MTYWHASWSTPAFRSAQGWQVSAAAGLGAALSAQPNFVLSGRHVNFVLQLRLGLVFEVAPRVVRLIVEKSMGSWVAGLANTRLNRPVTNSRVVAVANLGFQSSSTGTRRAKKPNQDKQKAESTINEGRGLTCLSPAVWS